MWSSFCHFIFPAATSAASRTSIVKSPPAAVAPYCRHRISLQHDGLPIHAGPNHCSGYPGHGQRTRGGRRTMNYSDIKRADNGGFIVGPIDGVPDISGNGTEEPAAWFLGPRAENREFFN